MHDGFGNFTEAYCPPKEESAKLADGQVRFRLSPRTLARIDQFTRRFGVASTEVTLPAAPTTLAVGRIQGRLPGIVGAIASDPNIRILEAAGWPDFLSAAAGCADKESLKDKLMILGLGASGRLPSQRLVATIAPILFAHGQLQRLGLPAPRLVIFQATALGHLINGVDRGRADAVAHATLNFIADYIRRFYPDTWPYARLMTDDFDSMRHLLDEVITPLANRIPPSDTMLRLARDRCSHLDAMKYGIAHAFQLQALVPCQDTYSSVFGPRYFAPRPRFVLAYGGIAERLFLDVISAAMAQASPAAFRIVPKMHVISRLGRKPAYAPFDDEPRIGDGLSTDDLADFTKDKRIRDDWMAVRAYHADSGNLLDFLNTGEPKWTLE